MVLVEVIAGVGNGLTVTVIVLTALLQPEFVLAVTEYTVVTLGVAITLVPVVADKLVPGVQLYVFLSVKEMLHLVIVP